MMTFKPGLGYRPDRPKAPDEEPDWRASVVYANTPLPPAASNRDLVVDILNQGGLGSCTANAVAQALRASHVLQGVEHPKLASRLFAYYLGRAYAHETAEDAGTELRLVLQGLNKFGFPPEELWPYSDSSGPGAPFARMPSAAAYRAAFDQHAPTEYRRIVETGHERVDAVKRALAQRFLVVFGTNVSEEFCTGREAGSGAPIPPPYGKTIAGGHAMAFAGYHGDAFDVVNSWGPDFGQGGYCTFSAEYVAWEHTRDLWIIRHSPKYSE